MAYSFGVQVMGRSAKAGQRSAPAAAAYRAGAKLLDESTGVTHDYTRKRGVEHSEILAPARAGAWATDRGQLWNCVEAAERRRDAQVAREFRLSIPHQLDRAQQVELVRDWVQRELVARGMVADMAIHAPHHGGKNAHAHIMTTTRHLSADGAGFAGKAREWNARALLIDLRESWADAANSAAERAGHSIDWTHLSLAAQVELAQAAGDHYTATAKSYTPTVHEGPKVQAVRKALHSQAQAEGVPLLALLDRLEAEGAATGAHDLIRHNEAAREQRAAQQELAAAQRAEAEAKQEQARVIDARARFEERQRAAQQESSTMTAALAPEAPAMSMGDRARAAVAERERLREAQEQQAAQPEPAEAGSQKGASLWEKQEEPPAAVTLEAAAAHLVEEKELQEASTAAREELEALIDRKRRHDAQDAGAAAFDGMAWEERAAHEIMTVARDLICLIPGVERLIGASKHTELLRAHARAGQAMAKEMARLQGSAAAAEQRLSDLQHRPEAGLADQLASARATWRRGHRKHNQRLWEAAARLDAAAATTARSSLREDWKKAAVADSRALARDLRDAQQLDRPTDAALMASGGRFVAPAEHSDLLQLAKDQAGYLAELPAQEQAAAAQRADQSHVQRPSSGPRMG